MSNVNVTNDNKNVWNYKKYDFTTMESVYQHVMKEKMARHRWC